MIFTKIRSQMLKNSLAALAMAAFCVPAANAQTITSNQTGTHNGFYYSFWKDSGDATFGLREDGRYTSQWSNGTNNWVGGKGWNPGGRKVVNYSGNYGVDSSQNSYLALYGWTKNPLIEYYVIESYGSYNPASCSGGTDYGSFQSDGATYNVRRCQRVNQPSIDGTQTFYQYFSVRTPKKGFGSISGTITVGNHFDFWASKGLNLGSHDYMVLATEGYQSSGSSDITVWEGGSSGGGNSSSVSSSSSSSVASSSSSASGSDIVVRARGTDGAEHINLIIGGNVVADWTLSTNAQDYTYTGNASGDIEVEFDNDSSGLDVILDSVYVNGETRQAEDMEYNTATYDGECGGGSYSETMHCSGVIGFGSTSDCFSGNCNGGSVSSSSSSSSSVASSSSSSSTGGGSACQCNWYGSLYPSCNNQASGWGWENSASCIGDSTCNGQSGNGGIVCN
ncbi:glycoside hydrolase family 11 protein [Teredinibacter purpureus]